MRPCAVASRSARRPRERSAAAGLYCRAVTAKRPSPVPARHRATRWAVLVAAGFALSLPAYAQGPVLHEFFEANSAEDLQYEATTLNGSMPAAIQTEGGTVVPAPQPNRRLEPRETAYAGASPTSLDASYEIDSDTTRPEVVRYDDPFSPAVTPFKRLFAYDAVGEDLDLIVRRSKDLSPIPIGGIVSDGDDQFYGDLFVDVERGIPVRIPSVGPGARVLGAHVHPDGKFELLRDGADNWYLRMDDRKRVRLVLQLAIDRRVFGSEFADTTWGELSGRVHRLPVTARATARRVLEALQLSRALSPKAALEKMVGYFRAFQPSGDRPNSSGAALYEELALSQKGVCRHRAYAFVITALELGLPSRMVRNEAHAWVEVWDGEIWHRVDLGGAASRLDAPQEEGEPAHEPPRDPYEWPAGSESGLDMASSIQSSGGQPGGAGNSTAPGAPSPAPTNDPLAPPDPNPRDRDDERPESDITFEIRAGDGAQFYRSTPLRLSGRVSANGQPCAHTQVDVKLVSPDGDSRKIGSIATDAKGRYDGAVVIPRSTSVGMHDVEVSTPGDVRCGPGAQR